MPGKIAILLNGPPRVGKDTAAEMIAKALSGSGSIELLKFTQPVKDLAHKRYGLSCRHDFYEQLKDTPLPEFGGFTPRRAYIMESEILKKKHGFDAVARLFADTMEASAASIVLNPDVGFDFEIQAVVDKLGAENVLLIRVEREGHDFSQDCRTWVSLDGVETVSLVNETGNLVQFLGDVASATLSFVSRRMGSMPHPVARIA